MLEVSSIYLYRNRKQVFKNFSLNLKNSEIALLEGENGVGKTSLLNMISGLISPDKGFIKIFKKSIIELGDQRKKIFTYIPDKNCLKDNLSVNENLKNWLKLSDLTVNNNNYQKKKGYLVQKFYNGKKGSFLMLCKNGKSKVICCNEQLLNLKKEKIQQVGCIMGGLEKYRNEIEKIANRISKNFKGLFGIVGVDIVIENKKWLIIEINPRFTSAYSGLNKSYSSLTINDITDFYVHKKLNDTQPRFLKKYEYYF